MQIRSILKNDAVTLAEIHIASWRDAYRGILCDEYLDASIVADRLAIWHERIDHPASSHFGFVAEEGDEAVGFIFLRGAEDPAWGTLLDNVHVLPGRRGEGIGRALVEAAARETCRRHPHDPVYLWVFEENGRARRFYARLQGQEAERVVMTDLPGGGAAAEWRVVWSNPEQLRRAASPHDAG